MYEIKIQETNPANQPNEAAMNFLANIYLSSDQISRIKGQNNNTLGNQGILPLKDEELSKYKKVKEYNSVSQNNDEEMQKAEINGATFQVPKNALPPGKEPSIAIIPADFKVFNEILSQEQITQIAKECKVLRAYEIGPNGQIFDSPGKIDVVISESELPKGKSINDLEVLLLSNGEFEALPFEKTEKGITIKIPHCSGLLIGVTVSGVGLIAALTMAMKVQSEPIERADCAKWIDPNNQKIKEIANDSKRFNINSKGDIYLDLGKKMKGMNVGQGNHFLKPKQFIEKPEGDCVNFSSLFGSFLAAKGYPIRVVAGNANYPTYSGGHQWIETVIDGRIYYLDTFNPNKAKLVPIEVARKQYKLEAGKMCYPESPKPYNDDWYKDLLKDHDIFVNRYRELQSEHRILQEFCAAGIESKCKDATYIYQEAMVLRRELESKGIKVVD